MRIGAVKEPGEGGAAWRCKGRAVGESESGGLKLNNVVFVAELDWRWFALLSELVRVPSWPAISFFRGQGQPDFFRWRG